MDIRNNAFAFECSRDNSQDLDRYMVLNGLGMNLPASRDSMLNSLFSGKWNILK